METNAPNANMPTENAYLPSPSSRWAGVLSKFKFEKKLSKIIIFSAVVVAAAVVIFALLGGFGIKTVSDKEAAKKVVEFINNDLLAGKGGATLKAVSSESGLYKVNFLYQNVDNQVYVTRDGRYMFPTAIDLNKENSQINPSQANNQNNQASATSCDSVKKADTASLTAFVVSACPFGLQMQRAMAEAVKNVPALAADVTVRYISSQTANGFTSMHGDAEFKENLNQICIRQEQAVRYWPYVSCYIKNGDSASCVKSAQVNVGSLSSCVADSSRGMKYIKDDFALQSQYAVSGSPTMILNGDLASESGFGGRTADAIKSMVCCASKNQPSFCSTALNKTEAATSFSATYAGSGSGTGGNGTGGCQVPQN